MSAAEYEAETAAGRGVHGIAITSTSAKKLNYYYDLQREKVHDIILEQCKTVY